MSLYIYTQPLRKSFYDDFENELFDSLIPCNIFNGLCGSRCGYRRNPYDTLEKQLNKIFSEDNQELIKFNPKINLSEDEHNYYIHADLPGMTKDQVNMEVDYEDRNITISGERKNIHKNNNDKNPKEDEKRNKQEKEQENEQEQNSTEENAMETESNESTEQNQQKQEQKSKSQKTNGYHYSLIESNYGSFSRSFTLPKDANIEQIQAKMENGVLEIIINKNKIPNNQTRSIQIQ